MWGETERSGEKKLQDSLLADQVYVPYPASWNYGGEG
jgi:hypothetical protein